MEDDMELVVVLIIMIALWLMPNFMRLILGLLARYAGKRIENLFNDDSQDGAANRPQQPPRSHKKVDESIGEYVDYEEIKTNN
jgi:hypothetical protein